MYNLVVCKDIVKGCYISHPTLDHALQNPVNSSMGVNIENDKYLLSVFLNQNIMYKDWAESLNYYYTVCTS